MSKQAQFPKSITDEQGVKHTLIEADGKSAVYRSRKDGKLYSFGYHDVLSLVHKNI